MTALLTALLNLQHAATPEAAQAIARKALDDGADPADVAAALCEWADLYDQTVTTLEAS